MENVLFECEDRSGMVADGIRFASSDIGLVIGSPRNKDRVHITADDARKLRDALDQWLRDLDR